MNTDISDLVQRHFSTYDTFARHMGIDMIMIKPGYAKAVMPLETPQKNGLGVAHGGAVFGLADVAFGGASNANGEVALGVVSSINYMSAGKIGPLTAEARELHRSRKLGHYEVLIFDGNGALIAVCRATAYYRGGQLLGITDE